MIGESGCVRVVLLDSEIGLVVQQPVEHMCRIPHDMSRSTTMHGVGRTSLVMSR
ncbi:MAG: hypothetical protein ACRD3Q_11980 [Terriglobales bacterium]